MKWEAPVVPGIKYKQTSIVSNGTASTALDGQGYCVTSISTSNGFNTIKYTATAGNEVAVQYRMTRSTTDNSAVYFEYQSGSRIALPSFSSTAATVNFQGANYPVTYNANKVDVKFVMDLQTKSIKMYLASTLGGPFTLIATAAFTTTNISSNLFQIWHYGPNSRIDNLIVTNNGTF